MKEHSRLRCVDWHISEIVRCPSCPQCDAKQTFLQPREIGANDPFRTCAQGRVFEPWPPLYQALCLG